MRTFFVLVCLLAGVASPAAARSNVPGTVTFTAHMVDEHTGMALTGSHTLEFRLYDGTGDSPVLWSESHEVDVDSGTVHVALGAHRALDAGTLDGGERLLEITLDGIVMEPPMRLTSVPYAIRAEKATEASTLAGFRAEDFVRGITAGTGLTGGGAGGQLTLSIDPNSVQQRIQNSCGPGAFMTGVQADGQATCAPDAGDISDLIPGAGLTGGGSTGAATLSVLAGTGIAARADGVHLDTTYTDARYVPQSGGSIAGSLAVAGELHVRSNLRLISDASPSVGPELFFQGHRGSWITGIDVANNGGSRDYVLAGKVMGNGVNDFIYLSHNGERAPTLGVGVTPPNAPFRLQVTGQDSEPGMGTVWMRRTPEQTGDLMRVVDHAGTVRWTLDADYWLKGASPTTGASMSIKADDANQRPLIMAKSNGTAMFGFQYAADTSGSLFLRSYAQNVNSIELTANGRAKFPSGVTTKSLRVEPSNVPTSASSPCTRGEISFDADHVYVCIADNTWKRSAMSSW